MANITVETLIAAPVTVCFDAARDIDLDVESVWHTRERAIAGRTSGLIGPGESVTWRARHFGVMQSFTSEIVGFDRPHFFRDRMAKGAFRSFVHDHWFSQANGLTRMVDVLAFRAPFGPLGWLAERLVLARYLRRLLTLRADAIKAAAEGSAVTTSTADT